MPPIRSGSTRRVASTLRPEACSICCDDLGRLVVGELDRGRQLERRRRPRRSATRRSNSALISSISPARPFSASTSRKLRTSSSRAGRARPRARRLARAGVDLRVAQQRAQLGHLALGLDELCQLLADLLEPALLLRGLEERLRVHAVDDDSLLPPSSTEKSSSPTASSIRRFWSASSSTLPVTFGGGEQRQVGDLGADLLERAARLGLDLLAGLLEPPLAVGLELLAPALARRRRPGAPRRGSARRRSARSRSADGAPRAACAPPRGPCRPRRATAGSARAARRSSSGSGRTRSASARRARSGSRRSSRSSAPG